MPQLQPPIQGPQQNLEPIVIQKANLLDTLVQSLFSPKKNDYAGQGIPNSPNMQDRQAIGQMGALPSIMPQGVGQAQAAQIPQQAQPQPIPTQAPTQLPNISAPTQQTMPPQGGNKDILWEAFKQLGIPVAATIGGLANPNFLPGAAGLSGGFSTEMSKQRETEIKRTEKDIERLSKAEKVEREKWDDAYKTALELDKISRQNDTMGTIPPLTIDKLNELAGQVYRGRHGKDSDVTGFRPENTKETKQRVTNKFTKPDNIPQNVWDKTTDAQKEEYFNSLNVR